MSRLNNPAETKNAERSKWAVWYQPGSEIDSQIYSKALEKCKRVNQDINPEPFAPDRRGRTAAKIIESAPIGVKRQKLYDAAWITALVEKEKEKVKDKQASKPEWAQTVTTVANTILGIATELKPIIDIFVPSTPEYSIPYACLWAVFQGFIARKEKKDSIMELIMSLSEDLNVFEAFRDMFPTDDMKITLSEFYLHTVDLLGRLAEYYSQRVFRQISDALFPSEKYNFGVYQNNIKRAATRLKLLCEIGHVAEQKDIKRRVDDVGSDLRRLAQQLENTHLAQARQYASDLIDICDDDVGDIEHELPLWQSLHFHTDVRNHWSQNGTLGCLSEWRRLCDQSRNSILWVSTEGNGRQSWVTEFSVDLVRVFGAQGQRMTFGFCDRPGGVKWTPQQLLKQLAAQLVNQDPKLVTAGPGVFNPRRFRKSSTFVETFRLLHSVVAMLESLVIVIDRLDVCVLDPTEPRHPSITEALAALVRAYPRTLRVIVTTGRIVTPRSLPELPISFAMISTRRRPRKRYEEWTRGDHISEGEYVFPPMRDPMPPMPDPMLPMPDPMSPTSSGSSMLLSSDAEPAKNSRRLIPDS